MQPYQPMKKGKVGKSATAATGGGQVGLQDGPISDLEREMAVTRDVRVEKLSTVYTACQTPEEFKTEIERLWHQTKVRFLLIGKYLIDAKEKLTAHGEYEDFIRTHLPFGPEVARQIRAVAEDVYLRERLREEELPVSYSVAYQLTTLSNDQLEVARRQGHVRENVKRSEIISFKRSLPSAKKPADNSEGISTAAEKLIAEKTRLLEQMKSINERIAEIDDALAKEEGIIEG